MNIAIVDDGMADRAQLFAEIEKCAAESTMALGLTEYKSGEDFLRDASSSSFDAIFLDIYMHSLSGMEVARRIRDLNLPCQIVFVTSSSDFAIQSYEVRAFYYIVKPYTHRDILHVLNLLDLNMKKSSRYIQVKEGREWRNVLLADILYVDYCNHYVQIHTESAIISTYLKFPKIAEQLSAYREFLNCYRCIVVNMNKIKKVDDLFFLLRNGEYIPINRKHVKEIKARYTDYIFGIIEENVNSGD